MTLGRNALTDADPNWNPATSVVGGCQKHPDSGIHLADALRDAGYSVTTTKGFGIKGTERLLVTVVAPRQRVGEIKEIAESFGPVHMVVKDVSGAKGKVGQVLPLG